MREVFLLVHEAEGNIAGTSNTSVWFGLSLDLKLAGAFDMIPEQKEQLVNLTVTDNVKDPGIIK